MTINVIQFQFNSISMPFVFLDVLQKRKWENCNTIDRKSWGFRREAVLSDYLNTHQLLAQLVTTVRLTLHHVLIGNRLSLA